MCMCAFVQAKTHFKSHILSSLTYLQNPKNGLPFFFFGREVGQQLLKIEMETRHPTVLFVSQRISELGTSWKTGDVLNHLMRYVKEITPVLSSDYCFDSKIPIHIIHRKGKNKSGRGLRKTYTHLEK